MNKAIKGALLSGLVLPGLGQLVLKCYLRGAFLMLATLVCLAILVTQAIELATVVIGNLDLLNVAIDPAALLVEVSRAAATSDGVTFRVASWVMMLLWLGGTVDAYLVGRKEDSRERAARQAR